MGEIWIPGSADPGERYASRTRDERTGRVAPAPGKRVVDRCRIPTENGPCGHAFLEDEPEVRKVAHLKECAERNAHVIREAAAKHHPDVLKPWDPEYAAWLEERKDGIAAGTVRW